MFFQYLCEDYSDKKVKIYEGLLDIFQCVGVQVLWLENNSDCKGICLWVFNWDILKIQLSLFCDGKNCLDELLLVGLQEYIDGLQDDVIIVLYFDGSYGFEYYECYLKEMECFQLVCWINQFGSCSKEELVNVYDNIIFYIDYFLMKVIELFKWNVDKCDMVMIYVFDYGELLGENGVYLYVVFYLIVFQVQIYVLMVMWFVLQVLGNWGIQCSCLDGKCDDKDLSYDNLFYLVFGLLDVQILLYQLVLDIFVSCCVFRVIQ